MGMRERREDRKGALRLQRGVRSGKFIHRIIQIERRTRRQRYYGFG